MRCDRTSACTFINVYYWFWCSGCLQKAHEHRSLNIHVYFGGKNKITIPHSPADGGLPITKNHPPEALTRLAAGVCRTAPAAVLQDGLNSPENRPAPAGRPRARPAESAADALALAGLLPRAHQRNNATPCLGRHGAFLRLERRRRLCARGPTPAGAFDVIARGPTPASAFDA